LSIIYPWFRTEIGGIFVGWLLSVLLSDASEEKPAEKFGIMQIIAVSLQCQKEQTTLLKTKKEQ
jgi:hypothetical protein